MAIDGISWGQLGSVAGGGVLTVATAIALIRSVPTPPWRNLIYGALALGMFAIGAGAKLDLTLSQDKGVSIKVAELEKQVQEQRTQLAALQSMGSPTQLASLRSKVDNQESTLRNLTSVVNSANLPRIGEQLKVIEQKAVQYEQKALQYDMFIKNFATTVIVNDKGQLIATDKNKAKDLLDVFRRPGYIQQITPLQPQ